MDSWYRIRTLRRKETFCKTYNSSQCLTVFSVFKTIFKILVIIKQYLPKNCSSCFLLRRLHFQASFTKVVKYMKDIQILIECGDQVSVPLFLNHKLYDLTLCPSEDSPFYAFSNIFLFTFIPTDNKPQCWIDTIRFPLRFSSHFCIPPVKKL